MNQKYVKQEYDKLKNTFSDVGVDFMELDNTQSFITPLLTFFKRRARKWR